MFYLDTSFVGPLFVQEDTTARALAWLERNRQVPLLASPWLAVEFASSLARRVRMKDIDATTADALFERFADWQTERCQMLDATAGDFANAAAAVRQYGSGLRAGDALHLALARNNGNLTVMTFDHGMRRAAALLGIPLGAP